MGLRQRAAQRAAAIERANRRHAEAEALRADREAFNRDFLTSAAVATLLGISEGSLRRWRCRDRGPRYVKFGDAPQAHVRYRRTEVESFVRDPAEYERTDGRPGGDASPGDSQ